MDVPDARRLTVLEDENALNEARILLEQIEIFQHGHVEHGFGQELGHCLTSKPAAKVIATMACSQEWPEYRPSW